MADDFEQIGGFLSRWSRRKLGNAGTAPEKPQAEAPVLAEVTPPQAVPADGEPARAPEPLPSLESLTPTSDFAPFMQPRVDAGVKTAALKQLFKDPHFNVMDGLDTYIEDYSIPDPIPAAMMKSMYQAREHLFSDAEKALADAEDAAAEKAAQEKAAEDKAAEEKMLCDAADAIDAERDTASDELQRELDALDAQAQAAAHDSDPSPGAEPPAPGRKDA